MLSPTHTLFEPQNQPLCSPVTREAAEAVNDAVHPHEAPQPGRRRRADTSPRARRKKDHRDDDHTLMRINVLGPDEQHIMKDYAGNTLESRLETLAKLEHYRATHGGPPIKAFGNLGPKKGKTEVDWICALCAEHKNTFQKIAGHITSHHWKLKVWTCLDPSCGRKYCSLNELTRHKKESHKKKTGSYVTSVAPQLFTNAGQMALHRSITQQNQSTQSTANLLHDNARGLSVNYQSDSSYSDPPPSVMASHSHSSHSPQAPVLRYNHSPEPERGHSLVKRTSARIRSSRGAPYSLHLSHKSADVGSQAPSRVRNTQFLPHETTQSRIHEGQYSEHYDYPPSSAVRDHDRARSVDYPTHIDARKASNNISSYAAALPLSQRPSRSVANYISAESYTEAQGAIASLESEYPPRYSHDHFRNRDHHISMSNARQATADMSHFHPQNHPSSVEKQPHYSGWYHESEPFTGGSAAVSYPPGPDPLDSIPRQYGPITYDVGRGSYYVPDWYTVSHNLENHSGSGPLGDDTIDTYTEPYLGLSNYVVYGEGPHQEGAAIAARVPFNSR